MHANSIMKYNVSYANACISNSKSVLNVFTLILLHYVCLFFLLHQEDHDIIMINQEGHDIIRILSTYSFTLSHFAQKSRNINPSSILPILATETVK